MDSKDIDKKIKHYQNGILVLAIFAALSILVILVDHVF